MPQSYPGPIHFQTPVATDSNGQTQYKTVHLVIIEPIKKEDNSLSNTILLPLVIVSIIAVVVLVLSYRVKPGGKTNRLLNILDGINGWIERRIEGDIFK